LNRKKEAYLKECKNAEFLINTVLSRVGAYMPKDQRARYFNAQKEFLRRK